VGYPCAYDPPINYLFGLFHTPSHPYSHIPITVQLSEQKTVRNSRCEMNELVLPNDTNGLGNMMGGRLMHLMDICAAISAQRHSNSLCVTAAVDTVEFHAPILGGDIVNIEAYVNRAFNTSMEVGLNVWAENPRTLERRWCNRAYFTMVAVDSTGKPTAVPPIYPETPEEQEKYEAAARRRKVRLVLSGRLKPEEAAGIRDEIWQALGGQ
jgi:acyl-CoA hydrolase